MRSWKTEISLICGEGLTRSSVTSYKTYTLKDIRDVVNPIRKAEVEAGLPKRKLTPVFTYLLEVIIGDYLAGRARNGDVLQTLTIKDSKHDL